MLIRCRFALPLALIVLLTACGSPAVVPPATQSPGGDVAQPGKTATPAAFAALPGWQNDDLRAAWPAFLASCPQLKKNSAWIKPCRAALQVDAHNGRAIRSFFETHFIPRQLPGADKNESGLMTGYFEPMLRGARKRGGPYQTPLYRKPDDLLTIDLGNTYPELQGLRLRGKLVGHKILPYPTRAEITAGKLLHGKELLWVDDPIEAFFLQVQGSGRVKLADTGETIRLAYADQNGHPYQSIGRYLVDQGEMTLDQASAQRIKAWAAANPKRLPELLNANPSYVFFKEEKIKTTEPGPKGALGVPLTAGRSVAVDPAHIALGTPLFIATTHPLTKQPLQTLAFAQDTGSAIKGAARIDYFWGTGPEAGEIAGKTKQRITLWQLVPKSAN